MADRRLLENGVDLRQLEDASGNRLLEAGPNVAGGEIPFPGGYGYGSGGFPGRGGGGGLAGGGQGGEGSGGGGGTGTTTRVQLPFKPGLVLFIATNQTLGGWRAYADDSFHWMCMGMACWDRPDKSGIANFCHVTSLYAHEFNDSSDAKHGTGQHHSACIWIRDVRHGSDVALAHVSAFNADGSFDLEWDAVGGAGYAIYFVAARDQRSWGDGTIGSDNVVLDGLVGGKPDQDERPQGGFSYFHGDSRAGDAIDYSSFFTTSCSTWARPDQANVFDPVPGIPHASKNNVFTQAFWVDFDSDSGYYIEPPGHINGIVMSPWLIGSLLQGWNSLYLSNQQALTDFDSNEPMGFAWGTGARNSCYSGFMTPPASGETEHDLDYGDPSTFKPQMGFTFMRPSMVDGTAIGHSVGLWARMVEDDPTQDFHATIAVGRLNGSGRTATYHGRDYSWMGQFSIQSPGDVPMGRLEYRTPGEIVTITDQPYGSGRLFMLWMNGVTVPKGPLIYRHGVRYRSLT